MEKAIAEMSSKVKILNFRLAKTDKLIEESDNEALNGSRVNSLKEAVEEEKITKGESEEQVQERGAGSKNKEIYDVDVNSLNGEFSLPATVTETEKPWLLVLDNPHYGEVIEQLSYLQGGVCMDDTD